MPAPNRVRPTPTQTLNSAMPMTQARPPLMPRPPGLNAGRPKQNIKMPVRFQDWRKFYVQDKNTILYSKPEENSTFLHSNIDIILWHCRYFFLHLFHVDMFVHNSLFILHVLFVTPYFSIYDHDKALSDLSQGKGHAWVWQLGVPPNKQQCHVQ